MRTVFSSTVIMLLFLAVAPARSNDGLSRDQGLLKLTLDECIELALEQNPQVKSKHAQEDMYEAQVVQAKAGGFPSLSLSANVTRSNRLPDFEVGEPTFITTGPGLSNPDDPGSIISPVHFHQLPFPGFEISNTRTGDIYAVKIEAAYVVWAGGRIRNGLKAAKLYVKAGEEESRQQENEIIFNTTQAFYGVLMSKQQVELMDEVYETYKAHLGQVRDLYNEGLVSNLDLLQVKASLAAVRPQQIEAKNGLSMARLGLKSLLNVDLERRVQVEGSLEYEPREPGPLEDLYAKAKRFRPEVRTLEIRDDMAEQMLKIARGEALPTVSLFANYSWDRGQELPPNEDVWRDGYQAGAAVQVPLFDGFKTKGKMDEVRAQMMQLQYGKRSLELGIKNQVQQALLNLQAAEKKIEAEQENIEAAQESYEASRTRYSVGLATNLDVMDAQTQVMQAKIQYLAAVYQYNIAWAQLQAALGMPKQGSK